MYVKIPHHISPLTPYLLPIATLPPSCPLLALDDVCENPELIWTAEMQGELRTAIATILHGATIATATATTTATNIAETTSLSHPYSSSSFSQRRRKRRCNFFHAPSVVAGYQVRYRQLDKEIYVGNVYLRLYLKQPAFRLSNPVFFLEKLVTPFLLLKYIYLRPSFCYHFIKPLAPLSSIYHLLNVPSNKYPL